MQTGTAKLYNWTIEKASSGIAPFWLGVIFSLEILLIIPLDAVLMFFCLQRRQNILLYICIGTIASTISACIGYLLGYYLWDFIGPWVVPYLVSPALFAKVSAHIQMMEQVAIFVGALLPFPIKAISLCSGVFSLNLATFLSCIATARLVRFTLVGASMAIWGEKVKIFLDRHFNKVFLAIGAKLVITMLVIWLFTH
jgi:membrane protein YqaA with SNARE-associated domain